MLPASFQMLSLLFQVVDEWPFGGIGTKALVLTLAIGFDKILNKEVMSYCLESVY